LLVTQPPSIVVRRARSNPGHVLCPTAQLLTALSLPGSAAGVQEYGLTVQAGYERSGWPVVEACDTPDLGDRTEQLNSR
jgi:hypothetical protein